MAADTTPRRTLASKAGDKLFAVRYHLQSRKNQPILIVGCGHSGTSVLLAMLGAHSKLFAVSKETSFAFPGDLPVERAAGKARRNFDRLAIRARKLRWIEKTPSHILHLPRAFQMFPEARVLLIIRDGRDVACSIQDRTGDLTEGITRWVTDNRAGEAFWKDPRVHVLRYEALVEDRRGVLEAIMKFLGEDFEEQMLHHEEKPNLFYAKTIEKPETAFGDNHAMHRNWQMNQAFFDGRGKWQRLTDNEKAVIKKIGGPMLIEYGYVADNSW